MAGTRNRLATTNRVSLVGGTDGFRLSITLVYRFEMNKHNVGIC